MNTIETKWGDRVQHSQPAWQYKSDLYTIYYESTCNWNMHTIQCMYGSKDSELK